jgi:hypothetical protein
MIFKLVEGGQKSWCRLEGLNKLPKIIDSVKFVDRIESPANIDGSQAQTAAA